VNRRTATTALGATIGLPLPALDQLAVLFLAFFCCADVSSAHASRSRQTHSTSAEQLLHDGLKAYEARDLAVFYRIEGKGHRCLLI
jgi:hypothetical protein